MHICNSADPSHCIMMNTSDHNQKSVIFFISIGIKMLYLFSFVETPRKFIIANYYYYRKL